MKLTCPHCAAEFPVEAGFVEADGKRLAALLAGVDAELGRAIVRYLRFFKPQKTALKLAAEVVELTQADSIVSQRGRRAMVPALWVRAIEQVEAADAERNLTLPLSGHGYLRAVAFGIADSEEGRAEAAKEQRLRQGQRGDGPSPPRAAEPPHLAEIRMVEQFFSLGKITMAERDERIAAIRAKHGVAA
jgi:hypothetical protein